MQFFKSLYTAELPPDNDMIFDGGSRPLDLSRNVIISQALQNGFDYLCFIDSDIIFPTSDIILRLLKKNEYIVGAAYMSRANPEIAIGTGIGGKMLTDKDLNGSLLEMEHIGMGCTLIHCAVFHKIGLKRIWRCLTNHKNDGYSGAFSCDYNEATNNGLKCKICGGLLVANFFHYTHGKFTGHEVDDDGGPLPIVSEDYFFCNLAIKNGFKPKLATDIVLWHETSDYLIEPGNIHTQMHGGGLV